MGHHAKGSIHVGSIAGFNLTPGPRPHGTSHSQVEQPARTRVRGGLQKRPLQTNLQLRSSEPQSFLHGNRHGKTPPCHTVVQNRPHACESRFYRPCTSASGIGAARENSLSTGDPTRNWSSEGPLTELLFNGPNQVELLFSAVVAQESSTASTNSL